MAKSIFIVVEGIDGSGKGEMIKMLHNYLYSKDKKFRILTTREPTNGTYGNEIRKILKEENDPTSNRDKLVELFVNDRIEHLENTINPFLNNAKGEDINIILCDRYYYSTIAFQAAQGIDKNLLIEKNKDFTKPDIAFILDLSPKEALERMKNRQKEKFEDLSIMEKIRKNFLDLKEDLTDNIVIINASRSKEAVFEDLKKAIDLILV